MAEFNLEPNSVKSYLTLITEMPAEERLVPRRRVGRVLLLLGAISWLLVISLGLWTLRDYENSPGTAAAPHQWPADSKIQPARDHLTLIILAHPHCPCTR